MTAPKITVQEQNISQVVSSNVGVYGGIVIPAPKGTINEPILVTSDVELLNYFTPDNTVKVGYNMAFYSALAYLSQSNKLWVVRSDNNSLYGGVVIRTSGNTNAQLTSVSLGAITSIDPTGTIVTVAGDVTELVHESDVLNISGSANNNGLYIISSTSFDSANDDTHITLTYALPSLTVDGILNINSLVNPEVYGFEANDLMLITGANQGAWGNDVEITLFTYANSPTVVKTPNAFVINVYKHSTGELLESLTCSRDVNAKDGYGNNIYVEDVVASSNYINVIDNISLPSTAVIQDQTVSHLQLAGAVANIKQTTSKTFIS